MISNFSFLILFIVILIFISRYDAVITPTTPTGTVVIISVLESQPAGYKIQTHTVTSTAPPVTWTLTGTDAASFEVNNIGTNGLTVDLLLKTALDYETKQVLSFTLGAADAGPSTHNFAYTLNVDNVWDVTPTAVNPSACTIPEEDTTTTCSIAVTDSELNNVAAAATDTITCSLTGTGATLFTTTFSKPNCIIKAFGIIDVDTSGTASNYPNLILTVTDRGGLSSTALVTITITDKNDNSPTCKSTTITKSVSETFTGLLESLQCTDKDKGSFGTVICSTSETRVSVNANDCTVSINTAIDYEALVSKTISFNVIARDDDPTTANQKSTTVAISLTITNVFDVAPVFTGSPFTCSIPEDTTTACTTVAVADSEPGDAITCSFSGTNSNYFKINSPSCQIEPVSAIDLDIGGTPNSFTFTITATDKGSNSASATITVTITESNDHTPNCGASTVNVVKNEGYTGSIVTMTCTDADKTSTFTYAFDTTHAKLALTSSANSFTVSITTAFDYETETSPITRHVIVTNTGAGTPVLSTTVTINLSIQGIEDNAVAWGTWVPAYVSDTTSLANIPEIVTLTTNIVTITATDADKGIGSTITYSIVKATLSPTNVDVTTYFSVSGTGGVSVSATTFNRETDTTISIEVQASDGTNNIKRIALVTLDDVNEFAPEFTPLNGIYTNTVPENTAASIAVQTITVIDKDASNTPVTCSINPSSDTNSVFKMDTTGKIIQTNKKIEVDSPTSLPTSYTLLLLCKDSSLTSTATVYITVTQTNDATPVVTPATFTLNLLESQAHGSIQTFTVTDTDAGVYGTISCSILVPTQMFSLSGCTALMLDKDLDYETQIVHTVTVVFKDGGTPPKSASSVITINVGNINDNAPVCTQSSYSMSLDEQTKPATPITIYTIPCTDADESGATGNLNIITGNVGTAFGISGAQNLQLIEALDYETTTSYTLTIEYKESLSAFRTASIVVTVNVNPKNEMTPTFTPATTSITMPESQAINTDIGSPFVATDTDKSPHNIIKYELKSHTDKFAISNGGQLRLLKSIDYETMGTPKEYVLIVHAIDGGSLTGTGTITVSITDDNDNVPVCTQSIYTSTIAENFAVSTNLPGGKVEATDGDATANNNKIKYSIESGAGSNFEIDSATGQVKTTASASLDYDVNPNKYTILVLAKDGDGAGPNSVTCTLYVTLTDINEGTPTFAALTPSVNVKENLGTGVKVYEQGATDTDIFQTLTYSITPSTTFTVDSTGKVYLGQTLDYESGTISYTLTISAIDNGSPKKTGSYVLTVNVEDYNEFQPTCDSTTLVGTVPENSAVDTIVGSITCTDADTTKTLTYYTATSPFKMDNQVVKVASTGVLDYESATKSYSIKIEVRDAAILPQQTTTVTFVATVTPVNEFDPVFSLATTTFTFAESEAANYLIATITATDSDQGSNHGTLTYSILSVSPSTVSKFTIDPSNGKLTLANTIDYDTEPKSYVLVIKAQDGGSKSATVSITVSVTDVNDNAPIGTPNPIIQDVLESAVVNSVVKDLTSSLTDADSGVNSQISVTIASGNGLNYFKVVSKQILVNTSPMDALNNPIVKLQLTLTDAGTPALSSNLEVHINIKDVNLGQPVFVVSANNYTIAEDVAVGTKFYTANATDPDGAGTLSGQLEWSIDAASDPTTTFTITTTNGDIRIFKALDRETISLYHLIINIKDKGTPSQSNSMTLTIRVTDVNDNDPVFASSNTYTVTISENQGANLAVTTVVATDPDDGVNGQIVYSIVSQTSPAIFSIDSTSGLLKTTADIDREVTPTFSVRIKAEDKGSPIRSVLRDWTILIADLNDNDPTFGVTGPVIASVKENLALGVAVTSTPATDKDIGTISYSLLSNSTTTNVAHFSIDAAGNIQTAISLNRESIAQYNFFVIARDSGPGVRSASLSVIINVEDVNDNAPVLAGTPVTISVSEASPINTIFGTISHTDADIGINAEATYAIVSGNTAGSFALNSTTGQFSIAIANLDYETLKIYVLEVKVTDKGVPALTSTGTVTISVLDANDNTCAFGSANYIAKIEENKPSDTALGSIPATDADTAPHNGIKYKLGANIFGDGLTYFKIDETTSVIRTATNLLNRELNPKFIFTVLCYDATGVARTGTTTLTVEVTDVNDNAPVAVGNYTSVFVNENVPIGFSIVRINTTDKDLGNNSVVTYSLDSVNLDGPRANVLFQIHPSTGLIVTQSTIDREKDHIINFYVIARDISLSSTITVKITINDLNDNAPILLSNHYSFEIAYNITNLYTFGIVTATDVDQGVNGTVSYNWEQVNTLFDIDSSTGFISRKGTITLVPWSMFIYRVIASDRGPEPQTSSCLVRIDTFDPARCAVSITVTTVGSLQQDLKRLLVLLSNSISGSYPNARVSYMHNVDGSTTLVRSRRSLFATQTQAYYYAISNKAADSVDGTQITKQFISNTELLKLWRLDSTGTPNSVLLGTNFNNITVNSVQAYQLPTVSVEQWYQTGWGIAVIVLSIVLFLTIIGVIIGVCLSKKRGSRIEDSRRYIHDYNRNYNDNQMNNPRSRHNPVYHDSNPYGINKNSGNAFKIPKSGNFGDGRTITPVDVKY